MVYNDSVFGGISWNRDMTKVCFIGETPEIATYKPWFKDEEEPKPEEEEKNNDKDGEKKPEEKKEEHWQDEKFLYEENFGEIMPSKKRPAIFVFDLKANKLQ